MQIKLEQPLITENSLLSGDENLSFLHVKHIIAPDYACQFLLIKKADFPLVKLASGLAV